MKRKNCAWFSGDRVDPYDGWANDHKKLKSFDKSFDYIFDLHPIQKIARKQRRKLLTEYFELLNTIKKAEKDIKKIYVNNKKVIRKEDKIDPLDNFWGSLLFGPTWESLKNKGKGLAAQIETKEMPELTIESLREFDKRYTEEQNKKRAELRLASESVRIFNKAMSRPDELTMIEKMHHAITPARPFKFKVPFNKLIVDANNEIYEYYFADGKVHYRYNYSAYLK